MAASAGFLEKVTSGQDLVISAATWNAFIDAALDTIRRRSTRPGTVPVQEDGPAIVLVQNGSGADVVRFGVLSLFAQSPVVTPTANLPEFQERVLMTGKVPGGAGEPFVVMLEPAADGIIGRAVIAGAVPVQIDVTDAAHGFAQTAAGDTAKLVSAAAAATGTVQILWKESGTGTKWGIVLLPVAQAAGGVAAFNGARTDVASLTLANSTTTAVTFASVTANSTAGYFAIGQPTRLAAPESGWYWIGAQARMEFAIGSAANFPGCDIYVNGGSTFTDANEGKFQPANGGTLVFNFSTPFYLDGGAYIELKLNQLSGADCDVDEAILWMIKIQTGATGATGAAGANGTDGDDGAAGADGADGAGADWVTPPTGADDAGVKGQFAKDANFVYAYDDADSLWVRWARETFALSATHFALDAPVSGTSGAGVNFTVTALAVDDTTATGYAGTVHLAASPTDATPATFTPNDVTLTSGTGTFSMTAVPDSNPENITITASDGSITDGADSVHFEVV